jgi:glycopeptide antibiotics resistance protein
LEWGFSMVIEFDIFALLGLLLIFALVGWYLKKKRGNSRIYLIFYGFFCVYLIALFSNTIFPLAYLHNDNIPNLWHSINCIPSLGIFKWGSLMNLFILIPFGFIIPFMRKISNALFMLPAILVPGFLIEFIQFLSGLASGGFTWRLIDINDYISYSLGIALGYLVFRLAASLVLEIYPDEVEGQTVMNYIREVFDRSTPKPPYEAFSDEGY